jgi:hypothetical protein
MLFKLPFKSAVFACVATLLASPAWAHGSDEGLVWGGALHIVTSPLALAALIGLVAVLFGTQEQLCFDLAVTTAASAALAGAVAGYWVGPSAVKWAQYAVPCGLVLLGFTALMGLQPGRNASLTLAVLGGCTAGLAAQLHSASWQSVLGLTATTALTTIVPLMTHHQLMRFKSMRAIVPIAKRVVGSWVLALGALLAVMAARVMALAA